MQFGMIAETSNREQVLSHSPLWCFEFAFEEEEEEEENPIDRCSFEMEHAEECCWSPCDRRLLAEAEAITAEEGRLGSGPPPAGDFDEDGGDEAEGGEDELDANCSIPKAARRDTLFGREAA